jgi:hypothetical protein
MVRPLAGFSNLQKIYSTGIRFLLQSPRHYGLATFVRSTCDQKSLYASLPSIFRSLGVNFGEVPFVTGDCDDEGTYVN